jgi:hypothetical protein
MKKQYDDTDLDSSLKRLNSDLMWKTKQKQELKNRIITDIEKMEPQGRIKTSILFSPIKKVNLIRKLTFSIIALIILFGLFIGSFTISPVMAKVISNIPYLSLIFQSKSIGEVVFDELKEKGYKISGTGTSYSPHKIFHVTLDGSDDYYSEVKDEVKKTVSNILNSKGYDAYSVEVNKVRKEDYVLSEEEMKEKKIIENEVTKKLKLLNYKFDNVQTDPTEKTIFINIVGSKKYYNSVQDDVEKMALEVVDGNKYTGYKINVTRVTVEVTKADKGSQIIPTIAEGLMSKKEYNVTGVSYKSKPLTFIIRTSILSTDPTSKTLGTQIESMIVEFLTSEEISSILGNESYEIIVNSKDKKKIN